MEAEGRGHGVLSAFRSYASTNPQESTGCLWMKWRTAIDLYSAGGSACAARQTASEGRRVVLVDVEHPHRVCRKTVEIGRFLTLRPDSSPHRFRSTEPASPDWKIERYPRRAALAAMPKWHGLRGSSNSRRRETQSNISSPLILWLAGSLWSAPCGNVCVCTRPRTVVSASPEAMIRYARREAFTVLLGTVTAVDTTARDSVVSPYGPTAHGPYFVYATAVRYTLAVERTWKGPSAPEVTLTDYDVGGECGRSYRMGQAYLVYAQKDQRSEEVMGLTTTICSRVLLESQAELDRRVLGPGGSRRG
jgi:hypothetical protein